MAMSSSVRRDKLGVSIPSRKSNEGRKCMRYFWEKVIIFVQV